MAKKKSKKKTSHKPSARRESGGLLGKLFKLGFLLGLWAFIAIGLLVAWYSRDLPNITEAMVFERRPTIIVKASDGTILDRYGDIKGETVAVEDLPPHLIYAILATEDRRFYSHFGLDMVGIARAFTVNIARGGYVQGGSTITQQLAKNLFLSKDRKLKRKVQEALLALWLEANLTKDEILSAYLNRVYMGSGAYGIDAAARVYFNKSAKELTLKESATLAGLLKAPSRYAPSSDPTLSEERTKVVLNSMVAAGFVEEEDIAEIKNAAPAPRRKPSSGETVRYFTDYVVSQLNDIIGPIEKDIIIETTLDKDIQKVAETAITKAILANGADKNIEQGAALVLRLDGGIAAMVGGRDYGASEFNRVTHSLRSPGSSFKPFVYLAALERGWGVNTKVVDAPIQIGSYKPQNFGNEYYGEVSLLQALTLSLNTVAVQIAQAVGPEQVISVARRLGITATLEPNLSLALGSNGVPMIQMATAYAALGRGGAAVDPFAITRIVDVDGKVYYEHTPDSGDRQVIARRHVNDLVYMMRSVVENGTGQGAQFGPAIAGKTGTSQDYKDAWFIAFTDKYATAVWVGNDDNSSMRRVTGGSVPASVWREIMSTAQNKSVPQGNYSPSVHVSSPGFGFENMLSQLLSGGFTNVATDTPGGQPRPAQKEHTPLGRHQWDLND